MKECCSNQENTVGELVEELIKNYVAVWIILAFGIFIFVVWRFLQKSKEFFTTNKLETRIKISDEKIKKIN